MFINGDPSDIHEVFRSKSTTDYLHDSQPSNDTPINRTHTDTDHTISMLLDRVNTLGHLYDEKRLIERLKITEDMTEKLIVELDRFKCEISPKMVKYEAFIKTVSNTVKDLNDFDINIQKNKFDRVCKDVKRLSNVTKTLEKSLNSLKADDKIRSDMIYTQVVRMFRSNKHKHHVLVA